MTGDKKGEKEKRGKGGIVRDMLKASCHTGGNTNKKKKYFNIIITIFNHNIHNKNNNNNSNNKIIISLSKNAFLN